MALVDQKYTCRFVLPDLIVKAQDHTIQCPLYRDGALVAPSAGTVSVYDRSNTAIVDEQAATITNSIAEYTIPSATTTSLAVEEGWRVEWTLTVADAVAPDGVVLARNDAALVLRALQPVVTDLDLKRRVSSLDPASSTVIHSLSDLQDYLDEAWVMIQLRLIEQSDSRPNLIMSPSSLREVHLALSLALVFEDLSTRLSEAYETRASSYRDQYEAAWNRLRFVYDRDDDGQADGDTGRRAAVGTLWLAGR